MVTPLKVVSPGWRLNEVLGLERLDLIHANVSVFDKVRTLLNEDDKPVCHCAFTKETNGLQVALYIADRLKNTGWHSATHETAGGLMIAIYLPERMPWATITEELEALEREVLE